MRSVNLRLFTLLICILTLLSALPSFALLTQGQEGAEEEEITILAASDFQPQGGVILGKKALTNIANAIKADGISSVDALFYCGDYTNAHGSVSSTKSGMDGVRDVYGQFVGKKHMYFVQGNHDVMAGTTGMTASGNNDPAGGDYGLFVINNDDYMWYNTDQATVRHTAQRLIDYLNAKLEMGYDRPVFVLSHLPLHYSMRTKLEGDGRWAQYIFSALNEAASKGLNVVYLFGHDHSNGWDDYLGGGSVFLKKGDTIQVAKLGSTSYFVEHTLNFTYVNAGYTGYYDNSNGSDGALTSTIIKIKGDEITFTRYDEQGIHNMKSAGVRNEIKSETAYDPNTLVYSSPQTVKLTEVEKAVVSDLEQPSRAGDAYVRISVPAAELIDGGKYLMVYTGGTDKLILPQVGVATSSSGKLQGLKMEDTELFGDPMVSGSFEDYLFTFERKSSGWLIKKDDKYLCLKETDSMGVTATFEEEGSVFTMGYTVGGLTLSDKKGLCLSYSDKKLLIGNTESEASIYIYGLAGKAVDVINGKASITNKILAANKGETVTLKADPFFGNHEFVRWEVLSGGITPEDASSATTTFVMGDAAVKVKAVYQDHEHTYDCQKAEENYLKEGNEYYLSCACGRSSKLAEGTTFTLIIESPSPSPSFSEEPSSEASSDSEFEKDGNDGSVGLIVGISAGAAACILAVVAVIVILLKKKKN
ncbi:MAG: metallophosphoesterase [Clostridia bacterium]|nr:metallophosphoesterase [Clostridia bacterium]